MNQGKLKEVLSAYIASREAFSKRRGSPMSGASPGALTFEFSAHVNGLANELARALPLENIAQWEALHELSGARLGIMRSANERRL